MLQVKLKHDADVQVDTWLPLFPGFYGTLWEPDHIEEYELEYINEWREREPFVSSEPISWDDVDWNWKEYMERVSKDAVLSIQHALKEEGFIESLEFQELRSPREYNFDNDSIDILAVLTSKNIVNIINAIENNFNDWSKYLKDCYTSCDGFMSFCSNDPADWIIADCIEDSHKLGSILQFLVITVCDYTENDLYEDTTRDNYWLEYTCEEYSTPHGSL